MLTLGLKGHQEITVTTEMTAKHVGSGVVNVFATPMMIALMEKTASLSVASELSDDESTVGTNINVSHCAPTPVGMRVTCDTEIVEIDHRRIVFKVAAYDEAGLIGEGTHERFIINVTKFQAKADLKL